MPATEAESARRLSSRVAVSEATMPSICRFRIFPGALEAVLRPNNETKFEMFPPSPGRMPIPIPMQADRSIFKNCSLNSFLENPKPRILKSAGPWLLIFE